MERRDFLKYIGFGAIATSISLPSFPEVQKKIESLNKEISNEDQFWHIRKRMKEVAQTDWEYYFRLTRDQLNVQYSVLLFQNGNIHRESWYLSKAMFQEGGHVDYSFNYMAQEHLFLRLMDSVDRFNSLSKEKQEQMILDYKNIRWPQP